MTASLDAIPPLEGPTVGAPRSDLRPVLASGAARALLLPVSASLNLVTSSLVIGAVGPHSYGAVILIGTLFQLLPFADLGVGSAVARAVAASPFPASDWHVAKVIRRSRRALFVSGAGLILISVVLGLTGGWQPILGLSGQVDHPNLTATLTIVLFALGLPLALGQRVLMGAQKNHLAVAATAAQPVAALALTIGLRLAGASNDAYVLIYPLALLATSATATMLAHRTTGIRVTWAGPANVRVLSVALPMFLMTVGLPIGLQSDKIVVSHQLTPSALTEYALAFQLYAPGWAVLSTAAFSLLPVFTRRRARGQSNRTMWFQVTGAFVGLSFLAGLAFVLAGPFVARIVTHGRIRLDLDLRIAFASLLVVQTMTIVTAGLLNRPDELRFQAACVLNMMVANLGLSWILAARIGVAGPVIASAVTVLGLMTLPAWLFAYRTTKGEDPLARLGRSFAGP